MEARLFADTRWNLVRSEKSYSLGSGDRTMYIISKNINGNTLYAKFDIEQSLSDSIYHKEDAPLRMKVNVRIDMLEDSSGKAPNGKSSFSFTVVRKSSVVQAKHKSRKAAFTPSVFPVSKPRRSMDIRITQLRGRT